MTNDPTPISPISSPSSVFAASHYDHPSLLSERSVVEDQLVAMLRLEQTYQVDRIPCRNHADAYDRPHDDWRRKICEWSYRVVDHFHIDREVVSVTMNLFDRFLALHRTNCTSACQCPSCQRSVDSRTFQLAAMTSLYLSIKVHGEVVSCSEDDSYMPRRMKMKLVSFVDLSRGQFSEEDLCAMERKILVTLGWKVNPTTSSVVISHLLQLMPFHGGKYHDLSLVVLHELSRYLSELSVCLPNMDHLPSEVAYAAVLVSLDMLTSKALPWSVREDFCQAIMKVTGMSPFSRNVRHLMGRLHECFWPEMLLDDCNVVHPISMAREAGLLDLQQITRNTAGKRLNRNGSATSVMQFHDMEEEEELERSSVSR